MAERIVIGYKRLCEVRLLHHYWLDEGAVVFDLIPNQAKKDKRLLTYDVRPFLTVTPTASTEKLLKGLRGVFKTTALGFVVAVPNATIIPDDVVLEFVIVVQNADFFNYTALTLLERKIYELYHPTEDRTYRYKENVPVFSNLTGDARGVNPNKALFLSTPIPALAPADTVESLFVSGSALLQLISDQPGALTQQLNVQAINLPAFVHQGDAPVIVPPAGLTGTPPAQGITLSSEIPDDVFAIIRIAMVRPGDSDFDCISGGLARSAPPVFQVRFKNRSTYWKYFNKNTGAPTTTETDPLPLTYFGNAGAKQKPAQGLVKKIRLTNVLTDPLLLVSEIFE